MRGGSACVEAKSNEVVAAKRVARRVFMALSAKDATSRVSRVELRRLCEVSPKFGACSGMND